MQTRRILITGAKFIIMASSLLLLQSCHTKNKEKEDGKEEDGIEWSATMCAPRNYPISGPHIYFFKDGKRVGMTEALLSIYQNWAFAASARSYGNSVLPDSIFVSYFAPNDQARTFYYEGGSRLPAEKIKTLFREGYLEGKKHEKFNKIRTGLAPGGRVCVWVNHVEVIRFKVAEKGQYSDSLMVSASNDAEYHSEYQRTLKYIKNHPIDYSIWEKPDVRYDLGFGFCSENDKYNFSSVQIFSKEGIYNYYFDNSVENTKWNQPYGGKSNVTSGFSYQTENDVKDFKLQLPVHAVISWKDKQNQIIYCTDVVLPKDLSIRFPKEYINPQTGKKSNYNRIVFGVEKDGEHCIVWLDGPGKQEKIMRFKGKIAKKPEKDELISGGYATEVTYY